MMTIQDMEDARLAIRMLRKRDALPWWAFSRRRELMRRVRVIVRNMNAREME